MTTQHTDALHIELAAIYAGYERELHAWIALYSRGVTCRKGCRTCCDLSIGISLPEAVALATSLTDAQYAAVAEHAQRVLAYAGTTSEYLDAYRHSDIGWCPFLDVDSGACGIYDRRPANCRHVYSNMPAQYCAKDAESLLEQDAEQNTEFLKQLDPDVNEDSLPYIAPLNAIFHEQYELYFLMLTARHFNVIVLAEMSWLIVLAREHNLAGIAARPGVTPDDFIRQVQRTGLYHEYLLTDCQAIPAYIREAAAEIDFTHLTLFAPKSPNIGHSCNIQTKKVKNFQKL